MKKSFVVFLKRNLAFSRLAIVTNLEYRLNYFIDAIVQPLLTSGIEILLWLAIFKGAHSTKIAGFGRENYLSYAMWAAFFSRIATSWMYEYRMIEDVGSGQLNSILVRPMSFYEYYLSQLMGYKLVTTVVSMLFPIAISYYFKMPMLIEHLPLALFLCFYYLILVHTISFIISIAAFYLTKISAFTVAKNLLFWILMGELFPLDMLPPFYHKLLTLMPFSAGVYLPVGYLIGRVSFLEMITGLYSVTISIVILNLLGHFLFKKALKEYTGVGA